MLAGVDCSTLMSRQKESTERAIEALLNEDGGRQPPEEDWEEIAMGGGPKNSESSQYASAMV